MVEKQTIDAMWDDSSIDVTAEVNFIWSIANKLRGTYQSDKYKDVIIPMVIIRRFECALAPTKTKVVGGIRYTDCSYHSNSLSNKMGNSLLAVRDINHKYIVVGG